MFNAGIFSPTAAGLGLTLGSGTLVSSALYTELMTSIIARRRTPETDAILAAATGPSTVDEHPELKAYAAAFKAKVTETVWVRSHDGFRLCGHWYPAEGARRTVICAHGWHSQWHHDFSGLGLFLHEQACNLLLIEQRCHGESEGDFITYGIRERYDILTWLLWLQNAHPGTPVYLLGFSMGAATVLMTAGFSIADRVAGIIADSAYTEPREIVRRALTKTIGRATDATLAAVDANCRLKGCFSFDDYSTVRAMAENTRVPCLFIHGDADGLVPLGMCAQNYAACRAPKDVLVVKGAEHCLAYATDPTAYAQKLTDFFAAFDPPPAGNGETVSDAL